MNKRPNRPPIDLTAADASANRWSSADSTSNNNIIDQMYYNSVKQKRGQAVNPQFPDGTISSNSESFLINRPTDGFNVSNASAARLSQTRQEYMREINERSMESSRPDLGTALRVNAIRKNANLGAAGGGGKLGGNSNSIHLAPEPYSPTYLTANLQLPRDRRVADIWNRAFFATNPFVRNAINLHATYPISKLSIKCDDKNVEKFFNDMADKLDLQTVVQNVASEFWVAGECFPYASFDENTGMWDQIYVHNPNFIDVHNSPIPSRSPLISLRPDPALQRIVGSNDPVDQQLREQLDPKVIHHVLQGQNIPLDDFGISHLKNLSAPFDTRGTSIIVSVWKDLMMYDKIREAKFVQADGMINPMTLVQIGTDGSEGFYPRADELESWRNLLETAQGDRDFKIVTHNAVKIERVGYNGAVMDTSADITQCIDNILIGLMVPKSILTQEGSSYSSASVSLDVMRQRYNSFRTMMSNWLEKKIFAPISEIQGFYKLESETKRLIVPQVEWNHMTLYDLDNYIAHVTTLVDRNRVSLRTLDRSLGLSRANENANIREEMIEAAIMAKEKEALGEMSLAELRSMDPSEPIVKQDRDGPALPGSSLPGSAPPGGDMGLPLMPDMGGGGAMPDMGSSGPPPGPDLGASPGSPTEAPTPPPA